MSISVVIVISIFFSAFFSGMEIAFVSSNKLRLELEKKQNPVFAFFFSSFNKNPGQYLSTMLVGNNVALVIYGIAFSKIFEPVVADYIHNEIFILLIQTFLSTIIILFLGEFIPKTLFNLNPYFALRLFAVPIGFFYFLFYPITAFVIGLSRFILKIFFKVNLHKNDHRKMFSRIDLDYLIRENQNNGNNSSLPVEHEVKLFQNALDFSKVKLRECMIPRTEMIAVDTETTIEQLHEKFIQTGFSKILIYKGNIDNVIGYIHSSELFKNPQSLNSRINPVITVPETMSASKLLSQFIQQHRSVAIIVDEFGGTSGMVTTEDIIEEIFGEIADEHDTDELIDKQLSPNEYLFAGRLEIDMLNEKYHFNLPISDSYETLAGFILFEYESIPKINTIIQIRQYELKIIKASNTKIELVQLKIVDFSQK